MTNIDPKQIAKAKEWVKLMRNNPDRFRREDSAAAAELIQSLPGHFIDAEKVREEAARMDKGAKNSMKPGHNEFSRGYAEAMQECVEHLRNLIAPPVPTLAGLIGQGNDPQQYQWAQADHRDERCVIIRVLGHDSKLTVSLLTATGATIWTSTDEVIPLPDLPRLVWPDEFNPEPAEDSSTPEVAPKVLVTEEDYRNAQEGTVIEDGRFSIYTSTSAWYTLDGKKYAHRDLAGTPRRVLRWGMGEQA